MRPTGAEPSRAARLRARAELVMVFAVCSSIVAVALYAFGGRSSRLEVCGESVLVCTVRTVVPYALGPVGILAALSLALYVWAAVLFAAARRLDAAAAAENHEVDPISQSSSSH